jgi:hypothetical protein
MAAMSKARGVYREHMGWGDQHSVMVDYGITQMDISEEQYRRDGYDPPFEQLPWRNKEGGNG